MCEHLTYAMGWKCELLCPCPFTSHQTRLRLSLPFAPLLLVQGLAPVTIQLSCHLREAPLVLPPDKGPLFPASQSTDSLCSGSVPFCLLFFVLTRVSPLRRPWSSSLVPSTGSLLVTCCISDCQMTDTAQPCKPASLVTQQPETILPLGPQI